jgi:hypothetical protein
MMPYSLEQLRAEHSTISVRVLPDGKVLALHKEIFNILISVTNPEDLELGVRSDVWEYTLDDGLPPLGPAPGANRALYAFEVWDGNGEPTGWTRHPRTGRRRAFGDPETEIVRR